MAQESTTSQLIKTGAILLGSAVSGGLLGKITSGKAIRYNPMEKVTIEEFFEDFIEDDIHVTHFFMNDILLAENYDTNNPDDNYIGNAGVAEMNLNRDHYLDDAYINDDGNVVLCAGECFEIIDLEPDDERLNNTYGDLNPSIPYYVPVIYKGDGRFKQIEDQGHAIMATTSKRKAIKEAKKYS